MTRPVYYFDLGNTRSKLWRCEGGRVVSHWAGAHEGRPDLQLESLPPDFLEAAAGVFGMSVLGGEVDARFAAAAKAYWGCLPEFARPGPSFEGLTNAYVEDPSKLGVDRWMGLIGAAGDCDALCVVGCGTAITIDVLRGTSHKGGYILPGLRLMQEALLGGTQKVRFDNSSAYSLTLGTSTGAAVRNAAAAAVVALVERVADEEGVNRLVLTGGDADVLAPLLSIACEVDPGLLLKGLMRYFAHKIGAPS